MKCILDVHKYMAEWMPTVTLKHENVNQCKCSKWLPFSFEQSMNLWISEQVTLLQRWGEIVVHSSSMTAFKSAMVLGLGAKNLIFRHFPKKEVWGGLNQVIWVATRLARGGRSIEKGSGHSAIVGH